MTTDDLIRHFGTKTNAITKLCLYRQLFDRWQKLGIPHGRQAQIQIATRGKLRADRKDAR